jgi:putative ABC transport system permease protein
LRRLSIIKPRRRLIESIIQDARVALRGLRRAPTFAATTVLILGLGIGMATAMFTVFRAVLVERLPVSSPDRLVVLRSLNRGSTKVDPSGTVIADMQREAQTVRSVAGVYHFGSIPLPFLDGARQIVINRSAVTANFFDVLGVRPLMGRLLRPEDGAEGAPHVIVISSGAWKHRFGGDPQIVGHMLVEPQTRWQFRIVGVAPPGLDYPLHADDWEAESPELSRAQQLVVARLAPGATPAAAAGEYFSFVKRLETQGFGIGTFVGAEARPLTNDIIGGVRPVLWALSAAVGLLLLIACVNVGNLLLLRASTRARELAIRRAIGATYLRLLRQLLVESMLLAIGGGVIGVVIAGTLLRVLVASAPRELPRLDVVTLDGATLAIAFAVTTTAVLLFGLLPSVSAARADLASPLRVDSRSGEQTRARHSARRSLVVSQVALALMLVMGAGLLARSLERLQQIQLGYSADHLSFFSVSYPVLRYDSIPKTQALGEALYKRLRSVPGVSAISPVIDAPFGGADLYIAKLATDQQTDAEGDANPFVPWEVGGADYFRTLGIPIVRGRGFRDTDAAKAEQVVVISEALARKLYPGRNPIGEHLRPASGYGPVTPRWTIVGVAGDTHYRELRSATPIVYHPFQQVAWFGLFAVRTSRELAQVLPAMQREVNGVDPQVSIWHTQTMDQLLAGPLAQPRLSAVLLSGFGIAALLLAAIGLYGVMASSVRERTRELGVRMALGASPEHLRRAVLRQALGMTTAGVVIGAVGALSTTHLLRALLYDVSPTDPMVLGSVCAILLVVAAVAAYVPARRATQIDPARALRSD